MEGVAEDDSRQHRVDQILVNILQQRLPYAKEGLTDAARDIREFFQAEDQLQKYLRLQNENAGNRELSSIYWGNAGVKGSLPRLSKPVRQRISKHRPSPRSLAKSSSSSSKVPSTVQSPHTQSEQLTGGISKLSETKEHTTQQSSTDLVSEQIPSPSKPATRRRFCCIFDQKSFASKGNYRKHLEDQHISRKFQQCEGCGSVFQSVPQAVNHCKSCPQDVSRGVKTPFHEIKMEKKAFGSEFTGECFTSMREYVDHLVEQSQNSQECVRPSPSLLLKFRALLHQPSIRAELQSACQSLFGGVVLPEMLSWNEEYMEGFIPILELGVIDIEPGPTSAIRRHMVLPFLNNILNACWPATSMSTTQHVSTEFPSIEAGLDTVSDFAEPVHCHRRIHLATSGWATPSAQIPCSEGERGQIQLSGWSNGNEGFHVQHQGQTPSLSTNCVHNSRSIEASDPALAMPDPPTIYQSVTGAHPGVQPITDEPCDPETLCSSETAPFCSIMNENYHEGSLTREHRRSNHFLSQKSGDLVHNDYASSAYGHFADMALANQSLSCSGMRHMPIQAPGCGYVRAEPITPELSTMHLHPTRACDPTQHPAPSVGQER